MDGVGVIVGVVVKVVVGDGVVVLVGVGQFNPAVLATLSNSTPLKALL